MQINVTIKLINTPFHVKQTKTRIDRHNKATSFKL